MNGLIPTPKMATCREGVLSLNTDKPAHLHLYSQSAAIVAGWMTEMLRDDFGLVTRHTMGEPRAAVHVGLLDDLKGNALFRESWLKSPAFASTLGREQGYILEVTPDDIVIGALTEQGLQHGVATLMQLLRRQGHLVTAPCVRIEDWPDFRFRIGADWLLNAEINRWGYERGDGRSSLTARMKRKLDMAARYKINGVWFDGFGWDTERFAGYAQFCRELAAHARRRHIRMAHAGYGGGYGFMYQKHFIYEAPYRGQIFENRLDYPDGEIYDCIGHPLHPTSRRYGTCLSNRMLADLKITEMVKFVYECQPGIMYIHDVDTGNFEMAHEGWRMRCPRCRQQWPDDEMVSERGAAAAYATWFSRVALAINTVQSRDGQYKASRDCLLVFVGPVYTSCRESDSTWQKECEYFGLISKLMGRFPNVQFGIREQFVSDEPNGPRVAMLRERLDAIGNEHGIFVVPFVGGDNYFSDQLVSPGPALHRYYLGADSVYTKTMGSVAEPAQLLCAEYGWNARAPGSYEPAASRAEALVLLKRCTSGTETRPEIYGRGGLLYRACERLYGAQAGQFLAEMFTLGAGEGVFPLLTGWGAASREVAKLLALPEKDAPTRPPYWRRREAMTNQAIALVAQASVAGLPNENVRDDVQWLRICLEVGKRLCQSLCACWEWKVAPSDDARKQALVALNELDNYLRANVPTNTTDPSGGDIVVWHTIWAKLTELIG